MEESVDTKLMATGPGAVNVSEASGRDTGFGQPHSIVPTGE